MEIYKMLITIVFINLLALGVVLWQLFFILE